jgi:hypothetical protein
MKESRKEFIKKAHSAACSEWKENIEKEFPKLFKKDALEVGDWVKTVNGAIFCPQKKKVKFNTTNMFYGYGFGPLKKVWDENYYANEGLCTLATDKEVEEALIKEANNIGYKNVKINNLESIGNVLLNHHSCISSDCYYYNVSENALWFMGRLIFWNGKWAEIVETITKEQAEKELGKTILN